MLVQKEIKKVTMRPNGSEVQIRPPKSPRTFTISRTEKSDMSSWWTYSDDAAWLTAWDGAFDDFFGYSAVLLNTSGVETAEMKQSWWVFTGAMTSLGNITSWDNVMIKFPVRWIKMSKSGSVVTLSITEELDKEGYQYYAHTKWTAIKDNLYLWAYKMSTWYKSLSGKSPLVNLTRASFRGWVGSTYWNWYSQITWYPRNYIIALYMMKYWNPNSKSVVWMWYTNTGYSSPASTWWTNSQTSATYWTSSANVQMKLFWLEDFWGNVNEFIDGCFSSYSNNMSVDYTNNNFQDSYYGNNVWTFSSWYMRAIAWTNYGMFLSILNGWGWNYYTGYQNTDTVGIRYAGGSYWGGGYGGEYAGVFNMSSYYSSQSWTTIWARLQYL